MYELYQFSVFTNLENQWDCLDQKRHIVIDSKKSEFIYRSGEPYKPVNWIFSWLHLNPDYAPEYKRFLELTSFKYGMYHILA